MTALNLFILSDGLTEHRSAKRFCNLFKTDLEYASVLRGSGNDVNRPLLEPLAEDSGGIGGFISASDDFTRKARGRFGKKLVRPFATDLQIIRGWDVSEVEPAVCAELDLWRARQDLMRYHGSGMAM